MSDEQRRPEWIVNDGEGNVDAHATEDAAVADAERAMVAWRDEADSQGYWDDEVRNVTVSRLTHAVVETAAQGGIEFTLTPLTPAAPLPERTQPDGALDDLAADLRLAAECGIDGDGVFRWSRPLPDLLSLAAQAIESHAAAALPGRERVGDAMAPVLSWLRLRHASHLVGDTIPTAVVIEQIEQALGAEALPGRERDGAGFDQIVRDYAFWREECEEEARAHVLALLGTDSAGAVLIGELIDWFGAPDWTGPQVPTDLAKRIDSFLAATPIGPDRDGEGFDLAAWQAEVWAMTQERYPDRCTPDARIAKHAEEFGEFAGEVVRLQEGRGDMEKVRAEFADALVTLMSAASSVGVDAVPAVTRRWAVLVGRPSDGFRTDAEDDAPLAAAPGADA
jgi:NTP pyrophosphatase (non-canonical NTP hydrolase)